MPRRFNGTQRIAAYIAAGGECAGCGTALEPGFHVDHQYPYSKGGATDAINAQALCATCNLHKGAAVVSAHTWWQETALEEFLRHEGADFLTVATPGAGKTRFALSAARELIDVARVAHVIVVVPSRHLRSQWAEAAHRNTGIELDPYFENSNGVFSRDYHGVVVTYQAVASLPDLYRMLSGKAPTLVIFDEVHHTGDSLSWGSAIRHAFELAHRRLLLSGTPFRSDNNPIPFVTYVDGRSRADYEYGYRLAMADGVVRPVVFNALDGHAQWSEAGTLVEGAINNDNEEQARRALNMALDPCGQWVPSVLRAADAELSRVRSVVADAGGLVVASTQAHARQYAAALAEITGEDPALVTSDEPEASQTLKDYARGESRWLVAVYMVSEGVDIPRLSVGVYATNIMTSMFFRQVVGRFIRTRGGEEEPPASLYIPSHPLLVRHAHEIEIERDHALDDQVHQRERRDSGEPLTLDISVREPVWSGEAEHHATILSGQDFTDAELRHAEELVRQAGMPNLSAAQAARLLRAAGINAPTTTVHVPDPGPSKAEQIKGLRKRVNTLVNSYARQSGVEHKVIHGELNAHLGDNLKHATVDTLNKRVEVLNAWLRT